MTRTLVSVFVQIHTWQLIVAVACAATIARVALHNVSEKSGRKE